MTALDGAGDAALIGWGSRTTSATSAAMLNSSFIQGFELDDYHPVAPLHSNSLVLPAMLSAAHQIKPVSGARFLTGAILGYETGPRVGQALGGLDILSRGWHSGWSSEHCRRRPLPERSTDSTLQASKMRSAWPPPSPAD